MKYVDSRDFAAEQVRADPLAAFREHISLALSAHKT